jgi:hypothetical protein
MVDFQRPIETNPKDPRRTPGAYLCIFFAVPIVLIVATLLVASTTWFFYHDNYWGLRNVGYSLTLHHADCQVLLSGDSSALTGLDPETITRETGLSACNIAEGVTVTTVVGLYPIDEYLRNNKPPKYIVFMHSPLSYGPYRGWNKASSFFEGMVYLVHFERGPELYKTLFTHMSYVLQFVNLAITNAAMDAYTMHQDPHKYDKLEDPITRRRNHGGMLTYYDPPETHCLRTDAMMSDPIQPIPEWFQQVRKKYSVNGTRVFMNVAPFADCEPQRERYRAALNGLHDNDFTILPISFYNNEDVHFTPEGARVISQSVAQQILADERANDH